MAEIWGTPRADTLVGTDEDDIIRGGRGEDQVYGGLGDDTLYGGLGNDLIRDQDGRSEIFGGRGSDEIHFERGKAWGGLGNDNIQVSGGGWAIGDVGNDTLWGRGALWGDQGPDTPVEQQTAGNDSLSLDADADGAWAHGGGGRDTFSVFLYALNPTGATVDDFHPGEDRITVQADVGHDEPADSTAVFLDLDANHNGVLEWTDSLSGGPDIGGGVYVDIASNTMYLVYGAGLTVIHGTTQITSSDWIFT